MSSNLEKPSKIVVLIKGAGEMGTGVAHRLFRSGFLVCLTEIPEPLAVRREVSFCEAIYQGRKTVEGVKAIKVEDDAGIQQAWAEGCIPILVDPKCRVRTALNPDVIVDAILAKRNTGTRSEDAPLVIGLGPGFLAGEDVHLVVETNRGHNLGRVIEKGGAEPDTGIPGNIGGYTWERVLRAPCPGRFLGRKKIGDFVEKGESVAEVDGLPVHSQVSGVLRGLLRDGVRAEKDMKVGDVDPRAKPEHCFTISDKARAIAGGVLEAILRRFPR
ncbi:MAG: EF2563 family selenium-dependent molybdenum hydroxylase system protein [Syntrophaceae bacterium]|nr:EF2563 family selenium-dependent molybdenum hydroxylase system protein [Syntrophaceae bacterium]